MTPIQRTDPPKVGDELTTLSGFLDFLREAIVIKAAGLDDEALRRQLVPSGVCLLGIVKHLAYVEHWWFTHMFGGRDAEVPWTDEDLDADWRIEPDDTTLAVVDLYLAECERSRKIVAGSTAGQLSALPDRTGEHFTLRWIVTHMIEETGRHAGHADVLRELIDGQTGE
jgi:uncharacterized damage-inducible protein DinB